MYYRIAIIGRMEYQTDDPIWQCVDALRRAGHAAVCIDPRKHLSVIKNGALNKAALTAFRQRFRPDLLVRFKPGMTAEGLVHQAQQAGAAGMEHRAKHFVIYGFVGKDNFGDELIFSILCNRIQERYPEAYFSLVGHGPRPTFLRHGVTSVLTARKLQMDYMLNGASALLFMAGIMFDDPFETQSAGLIDLFLNPGSAVSGQVGAVQNAWMRGTPAFGMGIGAGPLANPDAHRLLQLGSLCKPTYFARDTQTAQLLANAGVPQELVRQKADMAFSLDAPSLQEAKALLDSARPGLPQDYFIISLREWKNASPEFFDNVAQLIGRAAKRYGLTPVFVDFSPIDAPVHQRVADQLPASVKPVMYGTAYHPQEVLALFACSRFSMAMRLHASILSAVVGHPCLAFGYNNKVDALMEDMGLPQNLVPMDASEKDMKHALDGMMKRYHQDAVLVREYAAHCKQKALEAFQELFAAVDQRGDAQMTECIQYPRSVSAAQLKLQEARKDVKELEAKAAQLEERVAQLESQLTLQEQSDLQQDACAKDARAECVPEEGACAESAHAEDTSAKDAPLVSVVCPVYNAEPWLDQCIGSVLQQDLQDWELILIDDASTDGSLALCERYAASDARMRVVRGEGGVGAGANRNRGLELARGQFVFFLDSDDYLAPGALARMVGECCQHDLDGLFFGAEVLCEDPILQHKVEGYEAYYHKPVTSLEVKSGRDMLLFMLREKCFAVTPGLQFWRRSALTQAGVRYPEGGIYEDNAFSVDACLAARRAGMMPDKLFVRRVRQGSVMHDAGRTRQKEFRSNFAVAMRVQDALDAHAQDQELVQALSRFANIFWRRAYSAYAEGIAAGRTFNVAWMDARQMSRFTAFFRCHREEIRQAAQLRQEQGEAGE